MGVLKMFNRWLLTFVGLLASFSHASSSSSSPYQCYADQGKEQIQLWKDTCEAIENGFPADFSESQSYYGQFKRGSFGNGLKHTDMSGNVMQYIIRSKSYLSGSYDLANIGFTANFGGATQYLNSLGEYRQREFPNCVWWKGELIHKNLFPASEIKDASGNFLPIPSWVYNYWGNLDFSTNMQRWWNFNSTGLMISNDPQTFWSNWINGRIPTISKAHDKWVYDILKTDECNFKTYMFNRDGTVADAEFMSQGPRLGNSKQCDWEEKDWTQSSPSSSYYVNTGLFDDITKKTPYSSHSWDTLMNDWVPKIDDLNKNLKSFTDAELSGRRLAAFKTNAQSGDSWTAGSNWEFLDKFREFQVAKIGSAPDILFQDLPEVCKPRSSAGGIKAAFGLIAALIMIAL